MSFDTHRPSLPDHSCARAVCVAKTKSAQDRQSFLTALWSFGSVLLFLILLLISSGKVRATEIQQVVSPGGIKAWLVEEHSVPIVTMDFSFSGGVVNEKADKLGTATLLTALFDEGAGDLKADAFQTHLEENAIHMSFDTGYERFYGSLRTLTPNLMKATDLLALALQKPRFDEDAIERMRASLMSSLQRRQKSPGAVMSKNWRKTLYGDHPYSRPSDGEIETMQAITRDDLIDFHRAVLSRDDLIIGVVGAIDAKTLAPLLDKIFAPLPQKGEEIVVAPYSLDQKGRKDVAFNNPQTQIRFALEGIQRDDPDFYAAYVINYALGGGMTSRLFTEIREKRGLVYGVSSYLSARDHSQLFVGAMQTRTENTDLAIELVRTELSKLAKDGLSEEELASAKQFLIGSYPLRFDTSSKISRQLVGIQEENLGIDYFDKRNSYIEAINMDDIQRVSKRLFKIDNLFVMTVGKDMQTAKKQ
ncbi:MAG: insulinase family protein [Cohaesibacter sp.]|nr:insulinase family protein [Cohaesibacter sp.]MCV6601905.1 insulinase family protein [Cohaesibacter sp.]